MLDCSEEVNDVSAEPQESFQVNLSDAVDDTDEQVDEPEDEAPDAQAQLEALCAIGFEGLVNY